MRLDERVALITGGSGVIGSAIATRLAEAGADIVLVARRFGPMDAVAERIRESCGRTVQVVTDDLSDDESADRILTRTHEVFGRVDVLVNNAFHSGGQGDLKRLSRQDWSLPWAINVMAPFQLSVGCAQEMLKRGGGSIVNILSTAAFAPQPPLGAYGVTKAALWSLTTYLAAECAPSVRVNAVTPGTTSADGSLTMPVWTGILPFIPLGRLGTARETAEAVLFLASDSSSYTTGQNLFVDGGRVNCLSSRTWDAP